MCCCWLCLLFKIFTRNTIVYYGLVDLTESLLSSSTVPVNALLCLFVRTCLQNKLMDGWMDGWTTKPPKNKYDKYNTDIDNKIQHAVGGRPPRYAPRLLGGARGVGAPTRGGGGAGHIMSPRAQLVNCESQKNEIFLYNSILSQLLCPAPNRRDIKQ